jgi:hypothetical protein
MEEAIEKRLNKSLVDLAGDAMETMYELMNFAQKPNPKSWELERADDIRFQAAKEIIKTAWGKNTKETVIVISQNKWKKAINIY